MYEQINVIFLRVLIFGNIGEWGFRTIIWNLVIKAQFYSDFCFYVGRYMGVQILLGVIVTLSISSIWRL